MSSMISGNNLKNKTDEELKNIMRYSIDNQHVPSSVYHKAKQELEFRKQERDSTKKAYFQGSSINIEGDGNRVEVLSKKFTSNDQGMKKWKRTEVISIVIAILSIPWLPSLFKHIRLPETKSNIDTQQENLSSGHYTNLKDETLLADHDMRPLSPYETGKDIGDLPNYVYFYTSAIGLEYELKEKGTDFIKARGAYEKSSFEIQKTDNEYYILGYVSDEQYANVGSLNQGKTIYTVLFPHPWGGATKLVAIPFDSVYSAQSRTFEFDQKNRVDVLDIGFSKARTNVMKHNL